jgi:hypothetical protein
MHVIVVGHGNDPMLALSVQQDLVSERAGERADTPAAQVLEVPQSCGVGGSDAQDFAKLIIRNRDGVRRTPCGGILDPVQPDFRIAAGDGLIDQCEGGIDELCLAAESARNQRGDINVEADYPGWIGGIGLDKRGAPFRIAGPPEHCRALRGKVMLARPRQQHGHRDKPDHQRAI